MAEKEYIEKGSLLKHFDDVINNKFGDADFKKAAWGFSIYVDKMPAADVAPVRHGRWIINSDGYYPQCSECMSEPRGREMTKYCSECGALMDGDKYDRKIH